jgi:hypothetical protein
MSAALVEEPTQAAITPFNLQKQDSSIEAIERAVDHAIAVVNNYAIWLAAFGGCESPGVVRTLAGRTVLDVGPGPTLGAAVLMACAGARVSVADLDLVSWDPAFHPAFFASLLKRLEGRGERYLSPLRRIVATGGFHPSVMTMLPSSAEGLNQTALAHDLIFSNSTFEHVEDVPAAIRSLWSVTPPGGLGFHHVDFRDHRDFADPLRFLTLDQREFDRLKAGPMGNFGTRLRLADFVRLFRASGYEVVAVRPDLQRASADYVARVRPSLAPEFRGLPDNELDVLGALICVVRPA